MLVQWFIELEVKMHLLARNSTSVLRICERVLKYKSVRLEFMEEVVMANVRRDLCGTATSPSVSDLLLGATVILSRFFRIHFVARILLFLRLYFRHRCSSGAG